jgi:hypothetical protein
VHLRVYRRPLRLSLLQANDALSLDVGSSMIAYVQALSQPFSPAIHSAA